MQFNKLDIGVFTTQLDPRIFAPTPPALTRMVSTCESPVVYIRKGCKCLLTDTGISMLPTPTTHIERPSTVIRQGRARLGSPQKFQRFIMTHHVTLGDFDRSLLHDFMLDCFESPFDSLFDARLHKKMMVKVELASHLNERAIDKLKSFPCSKWQQLCHKVRMHTLIDACMHVCSLHWSCTGLEKSS